MKDTVFFTYWAAGTIIFIALVFAGAYLLSRNKKPTLRDSIFYNIIFASTLIITIFNAFFFFPKRPLVRILFPDIHIETKINNMISSQFYGSIISVISLLILMCIIFYMITVKEKDQPFYEPLINPELIKLYKKWNRYFILIVLFIVIPLSVYLKVISNRIFGNEHVGTTLNSILNVFLFYFISIFTGGKYIEMYNKLYPEPEPNEASNLLSRFNGIAHNIDTSLGSIRIDDTFKGKKYLNCLYGNSFNFGNNSFPLRLSRNFITNFNETEQDFLVTFCLARSQSKANLVVFIAFFGVSFPILLTALILTKFVMFPYKSIFITLMALVAFSFILVCSSVINDAKKRKKQYLRKVLEETKVTKEEAERILTKAFLASNIPGIEEMERPQEYPALKNILKVINELELN